MFLIYCFKIWTNVALSHYFLSKFNRKIDWDNILPHFESTSNKVWKSKVWAIFCKTFKVQVAIWLLTNIWFHIISIIEWTCLVSSFTVHFSRKPSILDAFIICRNSTSSSLLVGSSINCFPIGDLRNLNGKHFLQTLYLYW